MDLPRRFLVRLTIVFIVTAMKRQAGFADGIAAEQNVVSKDHF